MSEAIPPNQWHSLAIEAVGGNIKFFFNGDLVHEVNDCSVVAGQVLLDAWADQYAGHVHFDDVKVTSLPTIICGAPANQPPAANAGGPYSGLEGSLVAFNGTGSSDPEGAPLTYAWNFGDGGTASGPTPSHVYAASGVYNVSLTVTDQGGLSHTAFTTAHIADVAPTITLSGPNTAYEGETKTYNWTITDPGADNFTFVPGFPTHTYGPPPVFAPRTGSFQATFPDSGTVTVSVQVRDEDGVQSNIASVSVTVLPPPTPKFSIFPHFPSDCICTPLVMNSNASGNEYWFVKAKGTNLNITLTAHAVNGADPETVEARVYDTDTGLQVDGVLSASYPAGTPAGAEVSSTQSYPTVDGWVYRVKITTPNTPSSQPHYRLKFEGAAEAAIKSPSFASLEPVSPVAWSFNIATNDNPQFQVFWDGVPLPPDATPTITVQWTDAGQPVGLPQTLTGPSPQTITPPGLPKGRPSTLVVQSTNSHYRLQRTDVANDPDIYLTAVTSGQGTINGTATTGDGITPFNVPVTINLHERTSDGLPGGILRTFTTSDGSFTLHPRVGKAPLVEVEPPPGATVLGPSLLDPFAPSGFVSCGQTVSVQFKLNRAPVAVNDTASTTVFTPVTAGVLANDSDPDGDPLTVVSVTQGSNGGTVTFTATTVTYTPASDISDSFTYTVSDGYATATATVTVKIEVPNLANGKITGGVLPFGNNGRGGFNVQSDAKGAVKGELEYHNGSVNLHAKTMTAIAVSADRTKGWFAGILDDGRVFVAYVEDNGEPGKNDVFRLWVDGVPLNDEGNLTGGNVQIHKQ